MRSRNPAALWLACALGGLVAAGPARAQLCGPTDDPCVVAASINVASGSVFDLGARDLVIAANKTLTVQGAGFLAVKARNILLDDGARIVANGNAGVGGDITLEATGTVTLDPSSRIDVSGGAAGAIQIVAASLEMNGQLRANATTRDGEGGFVAIETSGNVNIGGTGILASAGDRFGCGGFMDLVTDGSVTATAPIEFKGGDCDGGDVGIDALGDITLTAAAAVTLVATYEFGSGGSLSLSAGGNVVSNAVIAATGSGTLLEGGGDGGDVDVIADNITFGGQMVLTGAGPDGSGGFVDLSATGFIKLNAPILTVGAQEGVGGDVLVAADGNVEANSTVDLRAGFAGGSFDAFAGGNFLTVSGSVVDASGTGSPFGLYGGTIDVRACNVTLPIGAEFLATGAGPTPRATIRAFSSGTMTIGGTISAGAEVDLHYRSTPPVFQPGFVISPAPTVVAEPTLPCCVGCGTTTTSTSSSTSSTIAGSSTSTVTSVTVTSTSSSTSSTTIPGPCGAPLAGCRVPAQAFKAKLIIRDKAKDSADKIVWKWVRGQATAAGDFGDPIASDDYTLCLWDVSGPPALLARVDAPAGGLCAGKACWRSTGRGTVTGYKYVDSELTPNGAQKVVLASGPEGKAKTIVKAKGEILALPTLPLALPVLVQLQGAGGCFETYFAASGVTKNDSEAFEARASFPSTTTTTSTSSTTTTSPVAICGNGARELPEECDDGNLLDGDCCSATCTAEPSGQACAEDGNVCTVDQCNGLGACAHPAGNAGLVCRPASEACDAAEQCTGTSPSCPADQALPDGTGCEVSACVTDETCTGGVCGGGTPVVCGACLQCDLALGCVATPMEVCRQPVLAGKSKLLIKDQNPDDGDKIVWKWARGEETTTADLGTPDVDDDYDVCFYDQTTPVTTLAAHIAAPAAGACGGGACWRPTSKGYKYVDAELTPDGVRKLLLKTGPSGSAAVTLKAKGVNVPMPALPLGSVLRLQLQGNGQCWEATFSPGGISQNDVLGFKATSD